MAFEATQKRLLARCKAFPLLDVDEYQAANSDLADVEPYDHAARYGLWEGRSLIRPERRWAVLADHCSDVGTPASLDASTIEKGLLAAARLDVRIVGADAGARARDAAERMAAALQSVGVRVWWDDAPSPALDLVFDPGPETDRSAEVANPQDRYADAVVVLTETPGATKFSPHVPRALSAAAVIALAPETHGVFAAAGVPCLWLELSPSQSVAPPPAWAALIPSATSARWSDRPIDVASVGLLTERRAAAWENLAEAVAQRRNFIHMPRRRSPRSPDTSADAGMALRRAVFARSKIALHLHAQEQTALDWRTVCDGVLAKGAVLIAEPGLPHPRLNPASHYFEEAPRRMPALINWLLDTEEGRREAKRRQLAARSALTLTDDPFETGVRLASFFEATVGAAR